MQAYVQMKSEHPIPPVLAGLACVNGHGGEVLMTP